nr:MAG TPA: hypothetical protein [Caudoviricetes sp.]
MLLTFLSSQFNQNLQMIFLMMYIFGILIQWQHYKL